MRRPGLFVVAALLVASCATDTSQPEAPETQASEPTDLYQVAYHKAWAGGDQYWDAAEIMLRLAREGDPRAEFWIGSEFLGGRLGQSDAKGVYWIRRAARHGHALAQFNLGVMYRDGRRGVGRDLDEARKWFELAAAQGDSSAKAALIDLERTAAN